MKKTIAFILILFTGYQVQAQADSLKPYQKNRMLPHLSLLNKDSLEFTEKALAKNKNIILMLFNPECDHCQKQLDELLSIGEVASSAQLVLVSVVPLQYTRNFYIKNKLEKYPYVYLGQDHTGFCNNFYELRTIPTLVFYNKKREFVSINYGNADKKQVLEALKQ
jgi:glutaredoxin